MATFRAFAWRSGIIEFGNRIPDGALPVDHGTERSVRGRVGVLARHAYDGKTLLIPGVPEAGSDNEAFEAWQRFKRLLDTQRRRPHLPLFAKGAG